MNNALPMRSSSAIDYSVTYLTHCDALNNYSAGSGASRLARAIDIGPARAEVDMATTAGGPAYNRSDLSALVRDISFELLLDFLFWFAVRCVLKRRYAVGTIATGLD